jgi:hypothetical protein
MAVRIAPKPLQPVYTSRLGEHDANRDNHERSDQKKLVLEILESTQCIRRRTDNREILAILDEIAWLARSI